MCHVLEHPFAIFHFLRVVPKHYIQGASTPILFVRYESIGCHCTVAWETSVSRDMFPVHMHIRRQTTIKHRCISAANPTFVMSPDIIYNM